MRALMFDPRIRMHLLPLPKGVAKQSYASSSLADKGEQGPPLRNPKPKKKAKASPKAESKCPEELKSFNLFDNNNNNNSNNNNNQPKCWSFNLSGCKESVQNGRCKKAAHVCIKCHKTNHGLAACRANKR